MAKKKSKKKAAKPVEVVQPKPSTEEISAHKTEAITAIVTESKPNLERNIAMFKAWLSGEPMPNIAKKYGLKLKALYNLSERYKWASLRRQHVRRAYEKALVEMQGMVSTVTISIKRDMERIASNAIKAKRDLTKEERQHFMALLEMFLKQQRLEDGKPTSINSETKKVILVMPPGMKTPYGLIPPDPRVQYVESEAEDKTEELTLEDVDSDDEDGDK